MKQQVILDTGPIVAFINGRDKYHKWTIRQWSQISPPMLTCEAVLSEACFLLRGIDGGQASVLELFNRGVLKIAFGVSDAVIQIVSLMQKYKNIPMSLADACLVRMAELHTNSPVLTFDDDFKIYRKNRRQVIPILSPFVYSGR